VPKVKVV